MTKRNRSSLTSVLITLILLLILIDVVVVVIWLYRPAWLETLRPPFIPMTTPIPIATPTPVATPIVREIPTPVGTPIVEAWWQVYFTDPVNLPRPADPATEVPPGSIEAHLIERINQAQQTIHIAAFEFNLTPVAEALIAAHQRGVAVQWVTDDEHGLEADEENGRGQFALLQAAGIAVRDDGRSALMHNKFWIFDQRVVWTGSTNITVNGMFRNNNNVIVIDSPELAAIYEREFQEMRAGQFGPRSPSTADRQFITLDGVPVQAWFASEDKVLDKLIPLVNQAQQSIRVMAFAFTHDALGQAILQRAQAGVDVMGLFETTGSETAHSELAVLACADVPARQDGNKGVFHHKVLILDETVVTGSLNFSDNADASNDENVLVITHPAIAALYRQEFDRRWAEGRDPNPSVLGCAGAAAAPPTATPDLAVCTIKGNIRGATGEKIYHLPGDPYYTVVTINASEGERWFCTEAEAQAAGWTRVQ